MWFFFKVHKLPGDGVTAPKHVGAVLMSILKLFLRQFTCARVGELKIFGNQVLK